MRMSCNGCRVLRKGCSENCSIRPCLHWIKSPESQANATVFLAKFYGRAGLMNLINAGPEHLRPAIFRSLLYEACGRIVNPIYGSVGLLWSGSWQLCQNAVEAILQGHPITQIASDTAETNNGPPFKAYDIRHISKDENSAGSNELHRVRTRGRFKRSGGKGKASRVWIGSREEESGQNENVNELSSHESALSHQSEVAQGESHEVVEESLETSPMKKPAESEAEVVGKIELELTLGHELVDKAKSKEVACESSEAGADLKLRLDYPA
ncbi:putative transcription factor AS2-LOB family [Helianthus annuus]|uniref:Putative LOB domain-containing protein 41 n=1 Tax=Helianthus annuus TaxID=4232 RepID=A0A251SGV9_HELAN|nr:LOB domain-containing protein 41 [Helianthus annuus]KAF5791400.1 putative transcription factor AS2-LOB family [Helianthus annuus]KAJ0526472.1 putative transcription factor AS2-LOB family [Helianthus annuus]KAJ0534913.1 putative transcription factor AS2-LOB family [Helianthus annuus]KAJ0542864.1 putative transcription factor AS2-LOB family [Helianthus annuus]KAJ0707920.1 putative transcription factor AS2-LOB family [Helianthus annuus]